uniref:3NT oxygenase beta subunit n=2 Tax=unclassified Diaphorobacter TaxID=2649760 RepID=M9PUZ8_9BURK|nr:3NT oxygenase beta subunit [Diaphorobacter sp. DS1]AGH09227.1 3NT oxygenase beta subunit [Diaphorobacter sp. DS2]5XBP_C Chain C, 3NT oxygenase beta subunit [Diaphorobacter sp. DS2]5XBP_F Chain F, 3NT oxygenase beta subunit [Diaphorobacter sp. DS2]5XBP_I Chain I, 3NT oxygenase beta subunit [Diaphorobacter sp. DS2]
MMINTQEDKLVSAHDAEEFHRFYIVQDDALLQEVNTLLTREAHLLDIQAYKAWLEHCVAPEIKYQVISRELRSTSERRYQLNDAVNIYNENYQQLKVRVEHQMDPQNWPNSPKIRFTRFVTNVTAAKDKSAPEMLHVRSNLILHRARRGNEVDVFYATREDKWKRIEGGGIQLVERFVDYPERILPHNLLVFL